MTCRWKCSMRQERSMIAEIAAKRRNAKPSGPGRQLPDALHCRTSEGELLSGDHCAKTTGLLEGVQAAARSSPAAPRSFSGSRRLAVVYAAFRMGPDLATSRHVLAQRRHASAHLRIVSISLNFSHSAAQASQISAQTSQSRYANREFPDSKVAHAPQTGVHS